MTTQREEKRAAIFGDYQSMIRVGGKAFLGIGETSAESRRLAIEAAGLRPDMPFQRCTSIITEPTNKDWEI